MINASKYLTSVNDMQILTDIAEFFWEYVFVVKFINLAQDGQVTSTLKNITLPIGYAE